METSIKMSNKFQNLSANDIQQLPDAGESGNMDEKSGDVANPMVNGDVIKDVIMSVGEECKEEF